MPFSKLKGKHLMLTDMIYQRGTASTEYKDYITAVYRDLITGKKHLFNIEEPEIELFIVKDDYRVFKTPRNYIEVDKCNVKKVKYRNVKYEIAKIIAEERGDKEFVSTFRGWDYKQKEIVLQYPYVLGGDIDIVTYYRWLWNKQLGNDERKIPTTGFMDIEVDQINFEGSMAKNGECEVNAISLVDSKNMTVHQFLYDNGKNPLIKPFIDTIDEYKKHLSELFDESYGKMTYKIYYYTNESLMLEEFFKLIHLLQLDVVAIWNGFGYDIPYILHRMGEINLNTSVMCHPSFPTHTLFFKQDTRTFEFANKKDYFNISSMTSYIDQLIVYAGLRKSKGAIKRVNLGSVAEKELKDTKLDYSDVGNIRTLPYEDYERFATYNIKDTLLQYGIDKVCHDIENLYLISSVNNVSYKDALKQTVVFRSFMYGRFRDMGYILGHNRNVGYDGDELDEENGSFEGAINGDPLLNYSNGLVLYGNRSKYLYGYTIDADFSSMYPNDILSFNIFADTMIGKLFIENYILDNPYDEDMGKEYIEDLIFGSPLFIGHKWHKLSTIEELSYKLEKKYGVS